LIKYWDRDCIAQLYFSDEAPVSDVCRRFFKISDMDMLRCFLGVDKKCGGEVAHEIKDSQTFKVNKFINAIKSWDLSRLFREWIWGNKKWIQGKLTQWLDDFMPEAIFFCGGDSIFAYSITEYINERYKAGIIFFITDDYVTLMRSCSPFYHTRYKLVSRKFQNMLSICCQLVTISSMMSDEYQEKFGKKSIVAMNSLEIEPFSYNKNTGPIRIIYIGGLHYNRSKTLATIGRALENINRNRLEAVLEVYCAGEVSAKLIHEINHGVSSVFCGALDHDGVKEKLKEADILLHVEAFDDKSIHSTRLSISTKIPEYMSSSKCILGIGPDGIASIEYLREFAFVISVNDEKSIYTGLKTLINNESLREDIARKAYEIALKNHNIKRNTEMIQNAVIKCICGA
jgi:glycosyltransferase involved in cell wall biosynthesis